MQGSSSRFRPARRYSPRLAELLSTGEICGMYASEQRRIRLSQEHRLKQRLSSPTTDLFCERPFPFHPFPVAVDRTLCQKACPTVTKYCVALTPGIGLKFRPTSKRMGPIGV